MIVLKTNKTAGKKSSVHGLGKIVIWSACKCCCKVVRLKEYLLNCTTKILSMPKLISFRILQGCTVNQAIYVPKVKTTMYFSRRKMQMGQHFLSKSTK